MLSIVNYIILSASSSMMSSFYNDYEANEISKVTEKAFHKHAKTCRAGFHKKPTKQDGTHMTIRSQITIPTSIFPTTHTIIPYSLFWNGCVYLCVVNSRIGLWVGVCIEGSRE